MNIRRRIIPAKLTVGGENHSVYVVKGLPDTIHSEYDDALRQVILADGEPISLSREDVADLARLLAREDADKLARAVSTALGIPSLLTPYSDNFYCICGNTSGDAGFATILEDGTEVEPEIDGPWSGLYRCNNCDRRWRIDDFWES